MNPPHRNNRIVAQSDATKVPNSNKTITSVPVTSVMTMAEKEQEVTRYQNITDSSPGYTATAIDVRPYAIAKFNFVAEFETELSLGAGEMVYLNRCARLPNTFNWRLSQDEAYK